MIFKNSPQLLLITVRLVVIHRVIIDLLAFKEVPLIGRVNETIALTVTFIVDQLSYLMRKDRKRCLISPPVVSC